MEIKGLNSSDIKILLEAIDAWLVRDLAGTMMANLVGIAANGNDESKQAVFEEARITRERELIEKRQLNDRTAVLLKAKLILADEENSGSKLFEAAKIQVQEKS